MKWLGVTKAEISENLGVKGTCQYPFRRSSFVIKDVGLMLSMQSSVQGKGKQSGTGTGTRAVTRD